jgi:excisionase family DNA binding protein
MTAPRLSEATVRGRLTLDDIRNRATISIPEAAQVLGIGRDAAYAAAVRGEIPVLSLGRALRVPVPKLLRLIGLDPDTEDSEGEPDSPPIASTPATLQANGSTRNDHAPTA